MQKRSKRVRPLLLLLLWIWAGCILLVLDLFWNVDHLDGIRPRAQLYRVARHVAHEMVGEPVDGADAGPAAASPARRAPQVRAPLPAPFPFARSGSRHPGGVPDAATPQGEKLRSDLLSVAAAAEDPAKRKAALRSLARMFGPQASGALSQLAGDPAQPAEVRDLAASLLENSLASGER